MAQSLHEDALIVDSLMVCNWGPEVFRSIRQGGVSAMNATCAVWENFRETCENIGRWHRWFADHGDLITPVRRTADISAAKKAGKVGVILGFQNGSPIEDRPDFVRMRTILGLDFVRFRERARNEKG